jgi:hypothetical protein
MNRFIEKLRAAPEGVNPSRVLAAGNQAATSILATFQDETIDETRRACLTSPAIQLKPFTAS